MIFCVIIGFLQNILNRYYSFLVDFLIQFTNIESIGKTCCSWFISTFIDSTGTTFNIGYIRYFILSFIIFQNRPKYNLYLIPFLSCSCSKNLMFRNINNKTALQKLYFYIIRHKLFNLINKLFGKIGSFLSHTLILKTSLKTVPVNQPHPFVTSFFPCR